MMIMIYLHHNHFLFLIYLLFINIMRRGKCPGGDVLVGNGGGNVQGGKCPGEEKCPGGEMSRGEMSVSHGTWSYHEILSIYKL